MVALFGSTTFSGPGIAKALKDMAFGPDGDDRSEFQAALDKAEEWRDALEAMAEVADAEQREHITALYNTITFALAILLEQTPPQ